MAARRTDRPAGRETRATSRKGEGGEGTEAVEVKPGLGLAEAMGIVTFLLLVAAILTADYLLGKQYGEGLFFS